MTNETVYLLVLGIASIRVDVIMVLALRLIARFVPFHPSVKKVSHNRAKVIARLRPVLPRRR